MRRGILDKAKADGDQEVTTNLLKEEWTDLASSFLSSGITGMNPFRDIAPRARHVSPEVMESVSLERLLQQEQMHQEVFDNHPGVQDALKGLKLYSDQWSTVNKAPLAAVDPWAPHAEQLLGSTKLQAIEVPEEINQEWIKQTWDYINKQKQIDSNYDPTTDPRIDKLVNSLNSMGRGRGQGEFFTGTPHADDLTDPFTQFLRQFTLSAGDLIGTAGEKIGESMFQVGLAMIEGTDSEFYKAYVDQITPKAYIDSETGQVAHTKGRVGGLAGPYVNLRLLQGMKIEEIQTEVDRVKGAVNWSDTRKRQGLVHYADILARATGGLTGMLATGGFASINLGVKGAARLLGATSGKMKLFAELLGTGVGYGLWNMGMYGDTAGYGQAFTDAMLEAPILMIAGKLGGKTEQFLVQRSRMPKAARRTLSGMMEGFVFSAAEMAKLESSLWRFMRNPKDPDAQRGWVDSLVGNVLGFGMFKGITGMTPGRFAQMSEALGPAAIQNLAARGQARTARRAAATRAGQQGISPLAEVEGVRPETMKEYSDVLKMRESETDPTKKAALSKRLEVIETRLETEAAGKDRTRLEEVEAELPRVEEISRVRELPAGREKTEAILRLQREARGGFAKKAAEAARLEMEKEVTAEGWMEEAGKLVKALPKGHPEISDLERAMAISGAVSKGLKLKKPDIDFLAARAMRGAEVPPNFYELAKEKAWIPPDVERVVETPPGGFVPETPKSLQLKVGMEAEVGVKPVQLSQIQARMEGTKADPVFTKMRGGVPGRAQGILGWFEQFSQIIRVPKADGRKLAIMAHEWSHAFEKAAIKAGAFEGVRISGWMMRDFAEVAKTYPGYSHLRHRSKVAEGWAEFWAREMMGDPTLKTEVPQLHQFMMDWISKPEHVKFRQQHDEVAEMIQSWIGMGAVGRGKAELGFVGRKPTAARKVKGVVGRAVQSFNKLILDDVAGWKRIEKSYLEHAGIDPHTLPITSRPTDLVDMFRMSQGSITETMIKHGSVNLSGQKIGEGIDEILNELVPKESRENFMTYLVARASLDALNHDMPVRASKEEYLYRIDQLRTTKFEQAADRIQQWAGRLLDYMQEGGVISEREKLTMQRFNPFFFMLKERLEGGDLKDPMEAIRQVTQAAVTRTQQAMIARALWLNTHMFEGYGPIANVLEVSRPPRMATHMAKLTAGDPNAFYAFFLSPASADGTAPTMTVRPKFTTAQLKQAGLQGDALKRADKQLGQVVKIELDPEVFKVLGSLQGRGEWVENMPSLVRSILKGPTTAVRLGATMLNPDFVVRNFIRDPLERQLYTKVGGNKAVFFTGYGAFARGIAEVAGKGDFYQMWRGMGGGGATLYGTEFATVPQQGALGLRKSIHKMVEWFGKPEEATRVNELRETYEKLVAEGVPHLDAALQAQLEAKEITTNFTRKGALASYAGQLIPYFTARIAGQRRFWGSVSGKFGKGMQAQAIIRGMTNLGGLSALVWWLHHDEEWYQQLPEWRRTNYWSFKVPGTDEVMSLPKPWEAGLLFGTGTEIFLEAANGEFDSELMEEAVSTFWRDLHLDFPFGWAPAIIRPPIEMLANYNAFTKKQLVPGWMERIELPERQYLHYTTETMKALGKALKMSPAKLEHVMNQYTGGMGRRLIRGVETVAGLRKMSGELTDIPAVGALFSTEFRGSRDVQRIFDLDTELARLERADQITRRQERYRKTISDARRRISAVAKKVREGQISREDGERRKYEIARPVVRRYDQRIKK